MVRERTHRVQFWQAGELHVPCLHQGAAPRPPPTPAASRPCLVPACRFTLPAWLPPTFFGTAVRYAYFLQATVKYQAVTQQQQQDGSGDGVPNGTAAAAAGGDDRAAIRVPLHLWPVRPDGGTALERASSALGGESSGGVASGESLLSPAIQSVDVPIKCWEIGPGTEVSDAVAHIAKLAAQPSRPASPGPRRPLAAPDGDDSRSEISHEFAGEEPDAVGSGGGQRGSTPAAATAAAVTAQQQQALAASLTGSGSSTPLLRRPSLAHRPSIDAGALSPSSSLLLPTDGGAAFNASTLRSFALRWAGLSLALCALCCCLASVCALCAQGAA